MSAMATSEPRLTVKQSLTPSEMDDVGALVREARWNQLAADWRVFLEFGRLYAAETDEGRIIATTATLPYGGRFAWISMVLVTSDYRRRGLATKLMQWAMRDLAVEIGGDIAYARGIAHMSGTKTDGHKVDLWLRCTTCFGRSGGAWKIAHEHASVPFYMDGSFKAAVDLKPQ